MPQANNFEELLDWSTQTLELLSPPRRRLLIRKMLMELRRRNIKRMRDNVSPDGEPWAERKRRRKGQPKKMMKKLATAKLFRIKASADSGAAGFGSSLVALIHHYGLVGRVSTNGPKIKYPTRQLVGITREDEQALMEQLVAIFN